MATRASVAARQGAANASIDENMRRIAHALDLGEVSPMQGKGDADIRNAIQSERTAAFLQRIADTVDEDGKSAKAVGAVKPNEVTPEPPAGGYPVEVQPEGEQDGDADDDDPKIAGHKLSFYEGRDDDAILKLKGVGPAALKQIREAQAARKA